MNICDPTHASNTPVHVHVRSLLTAVLLWKHLAAEESEVKVN